MTEHKEKRQNFRKEKRARDLCLGEEGLPRPSARESSRRVITSRGVDLWLRAGKSG